MDRRQSLKAVARSTAMCGTFQVVLRPVDDESVWLEKRQHVNPRRHAYIKVTCGRILKSDIALAEVVFDEAVPKGTYLLTLYTRCGRGTDFKVIHCRSEVSVK